ncbi:MAG: GNAT family N-acetyltransferase [Terrisporobacter othiniensis]|uniref:GNAT family N-acetyltransferase n=1 Tax=Terrisporobacter othiniensis TaxID=1577792 RepID=UPI002A766B30|nr:GNAT family N-acetyltransferase [Terrisporobacter othiniensis]MDY3372322.1 GNAT family N-acetyltransferase [Terrisporobacter othiniensis]
MAEKFEYKQFKDININDDFFDSLKSDYSEFEDWFHRKSNDYAYIQTNNEKIEGFLYLKVEDYPIEDVVPEIICDKAVKIGTMKIKPHGTRLGERFIKKSLDYAIKKDISHIYVTVFEKHEALIRLYEKYGFKLHGEKTSSNGTERVYVRNLDEICEEELLNYPKIDINSDTYLMSIYPEYHTRLFPDSILNTENFDIVKDVSHTNSIEKIYICKMRDASVLKKGDNIIMYRTGDGQGPALFRAVATSICVVEDVKRCREFATFDDYKYYCKNYSIFSDEELKGFYYDPKSNLITIKMSYNVSLTKRIIRKKLIEEIGMSQNAYWGFFKVTKSQLEKVLEQGMVNTSYLID